MPQKTEERPQETPGWTNEMQNKPDHGEQSYRGVGAPAREGRADHGRGQWDRTGGRHRLRARGS